MLQKQSVHLNMSGGLQKKDDQFLVIPSKLAVADNVQFDDASTVVRRGGQASLSLGAFNALQVKRAFTHQGVAVLEQSTQLTKAGAGGIAQVLNPATVDGFTPSRAGARAGMVTQRIASVVAKGSAYGAGIPFYDGSFDCASIGSVTCYVFETRSAVLGTQTIRVVMIDDANSNFRIYDTVLVDGTKVLVKPRVVANSSKFFIFFGSFVSGTGTFDVKSMTLTATGTASAITAIISGVTGIGGTVEGTANDAIIYDAVFSSDLVHLGLVVRILAGTTAYYDISTTDGFTVNASGSNSPSATIKTLTALFTKGATDYKLHAFYGIDTNVAKAANYNFTTATASVESTVGTAAVSTKVGRIAAYESSTTLIYIAFDSLTTAGSYFTSVLRLASFTHSYGSLSECASFGPWFVGGRIGLVNSRLYLPMSFVSNSFQGTTFVVDLSAALANLGVSGALGAPPQVLARIDYGESALDYNKWKLTTRVPSMPVRSNSFILPYLKYETNLRLAGTSNETTFALARAVIDFDSQLGHEEINGLTFLAGACPYIFDGANYVEEHFHHGPEVLSVPAASNSGVYQFPNASDTYTYCFTVAWQDAQGNWHESAPSEEQTITIAAASTNYYITPLLAVPPTQKSGMRILMYRTKGDSTDTTLYLASKVDGTFVTTDSELDDGEQIYTSGNVLPNTPAPACRQVSTFQKRLVLAGCGDGSRVHWSKVTSPGYGVEFSSGDPTHQTVVPAEKGRAVAAEEMDDQLVILCENGVCISSGTGPDSTGTQGQYSDPRSIISEVGCAWDSPKSAIRGPEGVWFRSPFGIRLVSRAGGLGLAPDGKQAGSEVDSLVSGNLVAVTGDAKQQVRFYQSSGTVLVWDYQWKQWTRFTGCANVDAVYADDRYYHLSNYSTSTPLMRYTDDSESLDVLDAGTAAQSFTGYIETSWLSFAGIQGFQRVYRLLILGRVLNWASGTMALTGAFGFDFDVTSPPTTETLSAPTLLPAANGFVQLEHHFAKQKCESLKIGISFTRRFRLTDLTLQVGIKGGYFKTPSGQRY
jgi:hypothetical protein